jgi:SSS family solute:Na+ symporter
MILKQDNPHYISLPGLTVLIGGMWIVNLNYWGCNQYITQRALGADLKTARRGILFAAFLKLLMPLIVVLPGIAAYVLFKNGYLQQEMMVNGELVQDKAAVVASLAGKANSIATIFTLDIYKKRINPEANEKKQVWVGRATIIISMLLAVIIAPFLGIDKKGGFEFIQEYTGFVSPGIFAMFILGFFWKKTTSNAALFATIGGFALSVIFKIMPRWVNLEFLSPMGFSKQVLQKDGSLIYEIPFLDRMGFVFLFAVIGMYIISVLDNRRGVVPNGLEVDSKMFRTDAKFAAGALIIVGIITALYTVYW